ncbi:MAG: hypothetical protein ACI88L_000252 [Candidatus Paceibacteria bacterium]|jgi:hypothetical protein
MKKIMLIMAFLPMLAFAQEGVKYNTIYIVDTPEDVEPYLGVYQYFGEFAHGKAVFAWTLNDEIKENTNTTIKKNESDSTGSLYVAKLWGPVLDRITEEQFLAAYKKKLQDKRKVLLRSFDALKGSKDAASKQELKDLKRNIKDLKASKIKKLAKALSRSFDYRRGQGSIFIHNKSYEEYTAEQLDAFGDDSSGFFIRRGVTRKSSSSGSLLPGKISKGPGN